MSLAALYDVPAPAKLNLFLHVTGRRPDGYHLLQSVFALIDWCDTLHFERRSDGRLQRHDLGPALPEDAPSLRAARALQRASGLRVGLADGHAWMGGASPAKNGISGNPNIPTEEVFTTPHAAMTEGVVRAWSDTGLSANLALIEVVLCVIFFVCAIFYAKLTRKPVQ